MKLRDHPLMSSDGFRTWPPSWLCVYGTNKTIEQNEIGILTRASFHALGKSRIMLWMQNGNGGYSASLYIDDYQFCLKVYERLKDCIGKSIEDVGDLELDIV